MKRISLITVITLALVASMGSALGATVAQGKSCTKLNQKASSGKQTLVCSKIKGKLIWQISPSQPKATGPQTSASPAPTPTPTASKVPTNISERATKKILDFNKNIDPSKGYEFNFVLCPNINKKGTDDTIAAYKGAMRLWANLFKPTKAIDWVLMGEQDYACWLQNVNSLEKSFADTKVWDPSTNMLAHCQVNQNAFCGYGTGVKPSATFAQYNLIGTSYFRDPDPAVVFHESVHFYQMSLHAAYYTTTKANTLPTWFTEGQANIFGWNLATNGDITSARNRLIAELKTSYPEYSKWQASDWLNELNRVEYDFQFANQKRIGYTLGMLAFEVIYDNYSIEEIDLLLKMVHAGDTWEQAISKKLGITKADLYGKIAAHLATEVK